MLFDVADSEEKSAIGRALCIALVKSFVHVICTRRECETRIQTDVTETGSYKAPSHLRQRW